MHAKKYKMKKSTTLAVNANKATRGHSVESVRKIILEIYDLDVLGVQI